MQPPVHCLSDAIIDPSHLSDAIDVLRDTEPREVSLFSCEHLGELDILRELFVAEREFNAGELEQCERRLLALQCHCERVYPGNASALVCIFLCLGLVKQRQARLLQSFGYCAHALSLLEEFVGPVNVLAVLILNVIHQIELQRRHCDHAEEVQLLSRMVMHRLRMPVPKSYSIWMYLHQPEKGVKGWQSPANLQSLQAALRNYRIVVASHGKHSGEAGSAAITLGAALYASGNLEPARKYLEAGLCISRRKKRLHTRRAADIYDLLVTICEQLGDRGASDDYRRRSRRLRICILESPLYVRKAG